MFVQLKIYLTCAFLRHSVDTQAALTTNKWPKVTPTLLIDRAELLATFCPASERCYSCARHLLAWAPRLGHSGRRRRGPLGAYLQLQLHLERRQSGRRSSISADLRLSSECLHCCRLGLIVWLAVIIIVVVVAVRLEFCIYLCIGQPDWIDT